MGIGVVKNKTYKPSGMFQKQKLYLH